MPPYDFAPIALFAWVPLLTLVRQVSLKRLLAAATLQGVLLNLTAHGWLVSACFGDPDAHRRVRRPKEIDDAEKLKAPLCLCANVA
jgi:apolipoprotein N-acyltransferase